MMVVAALSMRSRQPSYVESTIDLGLAIGRPRVTLRLDSTIAVLNYER